MRVGVKLMGDTWVIYLTPYVADAMKIGAVALFALAVWWLL